MIRDSDRDDVGPHGGGQIAAHMVPAGDELHADAKFQKSEALKTRKS